MIEVPDGGLPPHGQYRYASSHLANISQVPDSVFLPPVFPPIRKVTNGHGAYSLPNQAPSLHQSRKDPSNNDGFNYVYPFTNGLFGQQFYGGPYHTTQPPYYTPNKISSINHSYPETSMINTRPITASVLPDSKNLINGNVTFKMPIETSKKSSPHVKKNATTSSLKASPSAVNGKDPSPLETTSKVSMLRLKASEHFKKGSLIVLANNEVKKVEEMTIDDFVDSAKRSDTYSVDLSNVTAINKFSDERVVIRLKYGEKKYEADIETTEEHPYFVFERGWSSCAPFKTKQTYGLDCSQLYLNDTVVSMIKLVGSPEKETISLSRKQNGLHHQHLHQDETNAKMTGGVKKTDLNDENCSDYSSLNRQDESTKETKTENDSNNNTTRNGKESDVMKKRRQSAPDFYIEEVQPIKRFLTE